MHSLLLQSTCIHHLISTIVVFFFVQFVGAVLSKVAGATIMPARKLSVVSLFVGLFLNVQACPHQHSYFGSMFHWDPWPNLCFFQDRLYVWKWGLLFDEWRGLSFCVGTTLVAPKFHTSARALMQHPGRGICTLWTLETFCHIITMNNSYARYTQVISQYRLLQQLIPSLTESSLYIFSKNHIENTESHSSSIVSC